MMIAELAAPKQLVPVATGHSVGGAPYEVTIAPNYLAYQDRLTGAALYRRTQPIEACENADQRTGWREEEEWYKGQAQYLRALELEDCPAEWCDPYVRTDAWFDRQMNGEIPF